MALDSVQSLGADDSYTHTERIVFGLLMIGAPLLMLGAAILHPPHGVESGSTYYHAAHDHSSRFYASHTMFFLAAVLFVPTIVYFARIRTAWLLFAWPSRFDLAGTAASLARPASGRGGQAWAVTSLLAAG